MIGYRQLIWTKILILSLLNIATGAVSSETLGRFTTTALAHDRITLAKAEARFFNLTLSSDVSQTFDSLVQQAESLASQSIKQGFAEQPSIQKVLVTVTGERNGQEVPLLFTKVSRLEWQAEPKIQRWTTYFGRAAVLLGFSKPRLLPATSPLPPVQPKSNFEPGSRRDD